jgi:hypothetical protein
MPKRVEFKFDDRSLESLEKMERQGRVPGGAVLSCFPTAQYSVWNCPCCQYPNGEELCVCATHAFRRDNMDMQSMRLCSKCGKCSQHCAWNHTELADGGWGSSNQLLV